MDRTRGFNWFARLAAIAGLALFAAVLLGAAPGLAAPPPVNPDIERPTVPIGPTDIAPPVADPSTTTTQPSPPTTTTTKAGKPAKPIRPVAQPKPIPTTTTATAPPSTTETTDIPTPDRIDTGSAATSAAPTVLFWMVPGLAVLTLASGVSGYWLARSEQDRR